MTDRMQEINREMKKLNDEFDEDRALTDTKYLFDHNEKMKVLSKEMITLGNNLVDKVKAMNERLKNDMGEK